MFSELWNYVLLPFILSISTAGILYVTKPEETKKFVLKVSWYGVNLFSKASIYYEELTKTTPIITEKIEESSIEKPLLSYFDKKQNMQIYLGNEYDIVDKNLRVENDIDILFLKKNGMYKILYNYKNLKLSDESWNKLEKPFIQVELIQKNKEPIDICQDLDKFYVDGNIILGETFIQWLLWSYHGSVLEDDYIVKIFDKDVNLYEIRSHQHIKLSENSIEIIDDSEICRTGNDSEVEDSENSDSENSDSENIDSEDEDSNQEGASSE